MKQPHQTSIHLRALMGLFVFIAAALLQGPAYAQQFYFRNLSINDGLPSSMVFDACEDANGYIWFATDKGIAKYDGSRFVTFTESDGFLSRGAFRVFASTDTRLWFVTLDFKLYVYTNGKMAKVEVDEDVAWITESGNHQIWLLSRKGTLFTVDQTGRVKPHPYRHLNKNNTYFNLLSIADDCFLVSERRGVYFVDLRNAGNNREVLKHQDMGSFVVSRVFQASRQQYYISNVEGLYEVSYRNHTLSTPQKVLSTHKNEIFGLYHDQLSAELWLATAKGLLILDKKNGYRILKQYFRGSLCYNIVRSKEGMVWITTPENGANYTNTSVYHFTKEEGIQNERVKYLRQSEGAVYGVSQQGDAVVIQPNDNQIRFWNLTENLPAPFFHEVSNIKDTVYVVGNANEFIKIFDGKRSIMTVPPQLTTIFGYKDYYFIDDNKIQKGLNRKTIYEVAIGSPLADSIERHVANHMPLLIVGDTLFFYKIKNGYGYINTHHMNELSLKPIHADVTAMYLSPRGTRFLSTLDKGLYIERRNGSSYFCNTNQGLISDYCSKLFAYRNELWVATNKGVSRITLNKNDSISGISNYTAADVFISPEVNDVLFLGDKVYVATNKGITYFKHQYIPSKATPSVVIEHVKVNDKDTVYDFRKTLELTFSQNNISISYNSPSMRSNRNMFYRYLVTGANVREISGVSQSPTLQLGALAPDAYTIQIWSRNIDGVWSERPAVLSIVILKPFWQTVWFIVTAVSAGLLLVYVVVAYRLRQIRERTNMETRLQESELKALRLHMNPHFIFNTLNSLQKFTLERNPLEANRYISMFAKLMRWIMSYSDKQYITLAEELKFLDTYISLEQLRFDRVFSVHKDIDEAVGIGECYIPALVIQPFVENAIKYGIAGLADQGELWIIVKQKPDYLVITVEDNGVGREQVKAEQLRSGKEYESTGITYTNERLLLLLGDKLHVENAVVITDLYNYGKPSGTRVELMIPYHYD